MATVSAPDRHGFLDELSRTFPKDSHSDELYRGLYSTDASIYMQKPLAVVMPRDGAETKKALQLAIGHGVPVLPRAAGTSLAGQTTALDALVIDISKHMYRLLEVNRDAMYAIVEPGMVRDTLNAQIAKQGIMFAPETSTSNRANIGGMIGNNSSGMMSIRYGKTLEHTLGAQAILADGTETWFGPRSEMDATGNKLLDKLMEIVEPNRELIERRFPKVIRRVGGYSLDEFLGADPNLVKILVGSEGTLAMMTRAKVRLVPKPKAVLAIAVHFEDMIDSLRSVPLMVKHNPLSAEFMDGELMQMSIDNPATGPLCDWVIGRPGAVIPIEMDGDTPEECIAKLEAIKADLKAHNFGYAVADLYTPESRNKVIEVRKAGLGVMLKMIGDTKPISFIEDACVPVEHLADYADGVIKICADEGLRLMTYGHASVGVLHLKPVVNLKTQLDRDRCEVISQRCMELCRSYGGSWSGEHGDGIARGAKNVEFWGEEMMDVFRRVKHLFDPTGLLNPGKIFDTPAVMGPLRYTNGYKTSDYKSQFQFRGDGGFMGAVEMCNGVGACRKVGSGTMCPSYMATRDEKDTTRGRANTLRLAMAGQLDDPDGLASKEVYEALDLCLECKACKTECPSNVDMARMKSEFLHAYHKKHGIKLRERLFASSPKTAPLNAGWRAYVVNGVLGIDFVRRTVNKALGIAVERPLPKYATQTFPAWFASFKPTAKPDAPQVVLFNDTYVNYHEPEMGIYAVKVLDKLGYRIVVANAGCCGRPYISKGFLDEAKATGTATMQNLDQYAKAGLPILGIEPSCISSLKSDLPDLIDDVELGQRIAKATMPIEEFLDREHIMGRIKIDVKQAAGKYLLHGHCHQKALNGTAPLKRLMACDGKQRIEEVDSGCCGMAGSFGYEQEHYEISQQIGESRLFPAVRAQDKSTPIIANGFSCRHQVAEATGRKPVHFIVALGMAMGV